MEEFEHKKYKENEKIKIVKLGQGDLFTMLEGSQHLTKHAIHRVKKQTKKQKKQKKKELKFWRISVTFRENEND